MINSKLVNRETLVNMHLELLEVSDPSLMDSNDPKRLTREDQIKFAEELWDKSDDVARINMVGNYSLELCRSLLDITPRTLH